MEMARAPWPPPSCPMRERCEVTGHCWNKCKPQAVALTAAPIPLRLGKLDPPSRGGTLSRLAERLARVLRGQPSPPEPVSAPFLLPAPPTAKAPPPVSDPLILDGPMLPTSAVAASSTRRPTTPAQLVPARMGGFALIIDGNFAAVARTPDEVADMARDWASGHFL